MICVVFALLNVASTTTDKFGTRNYKNPTTARTTGQQRKRDAEAVVQLWFQQGIPIGDARCSLRDGLDVHTFLSLVKITELTNKDVEKILIILDNRNLIPKNSTGEFGETLLNFLLKF